MATKAQLEQQLQEAQQALQAQQAQAQATIEALEAQAKAKPVVVTARVPLALREDMKRAGMQNGENLQEFMIAAFTERLEKLTTTDNEENNV
ncbi:MULTISPECIES: hypothetical protein [Bacillati]|uniref:hypothetical protein n=1 Tax=Bacillati TaxID=1783272 RepID=UPI000318C0FE|nr:MULTISPECIES: hypothetical protein [Terrabacteria group]ALP51645.1 transposase [Corynebacterium glutamicum]ANU35168.1 transposase [Corynebacterium glutamicum]APT06037.1 transposase [Corynebacterium glutamicum]EOA64426.1 hypothetical protein J433_09100 [Corynebacterium glutamicum MT]OES77814.1 transposase [Listeria monocytogenes]